MSDAGPNPPAPDVDETLIKEIAAGVWVIPDRRVPLVPNIGIVVGMTGRWSWTSAWARNGARVLRAAQQKAGGRPLVVTTTHFHPEHGFGLQVFRDESHIVYNRSQLEELREKGAAYVEMFKTFGPLVAEALEGVELVEPHETYDGDRTELDLGGRTVELLNRGRAHARRPGRLAPRRADPVHGRPRRVADLPDLPVLPARRRGRERQPLDRGPALARGARATVRWCPATARSATSAITDAREYHELLRELTVRPGRRRGKRGRGSRGDRTRHSRALSGLDSARVGGVRHPLLSRRADGLEGRRLIDMSHPMCSDS